MRHNSARSRARIGTGEQWHAKDSAVPLPPSLHPPRDSPTRSVNLPETSQSPSILSSPKEIPHVPLFPPRDPLPTVYVPLS